VLTPSADAWPRLVAARDEIGRALSGMEMGGVHRSTNAGGGVGGQNAHQPPSPSAHPGGMMPEPSAIQSLLRDPNMLQNVMGMMNVSN
jgi:hypothetical protein